MKTELDLLIKNAYNTNGATAEVNKVYLELLKADLLVPVELHLDAIGDQEPYTPLFSHQDDFIFLAAFDNLEKYKAWAGNAFSEIDYVQMKGRDLIACIGENVFLALNPGTPHYKEFSPEEIQKLKLIVAKLSQLLK